MGLATSILMIASLAGGLPEVFLLGADSHAGSARSLGMGECVFMEESALGALLNPAMAAECPAGLRLDVSGGLAMGVEKRTRTVYDQFGSSIGESEDAFNRDADLVPGGLAASVAGLPGMPSGMAFAAGIRVASRFGYEYDRTRRNEYYAVLGEQSLSVSGAVSEVCGSASFSPSRTFTFGLGAAWATGGRDTRWEEDWVDPTQPDVLESTSSDLTGFVVRGSVSLEPSDGALISLGAEQPLSMEWTGDTEGSLDLPATIRAGVSWFPGNRLLSLFVAEASYSAMTGATLDGGDLGLRDRWSASAGIENHIPGGPACRFGFTWDHSSISRELDAVGFTAGLGFDVSGWALDVAGAFSPRSWRQTGLGPLPSLADGDSLDIEETGASLMVSLGRTLEL